MPDSDEPQKPRRPVMKPSVWSTRPIPQAAPERRTADAPTPKLKELAARAQQRASLTAHAADERPEFTSVGAEDSDAGDDGATSASDVAAT